LAQPPDTRAARSRAVIVNALTKPLNIVVPAILVIAGFLLHIPIVLVPVAVVVYGVLSVMTLFDEGEARKVLAKTRQSALPPPPPVDLTGLPPRIAESIGDAMSEEKKIEDAIAQANLPYGEVSTEIGVLMREMQRVAKKAAPIYTYLSDEDVQSAPQRLAQLKREGAPAAAADARKLSIDAFEQQVKIAGELEDQLERSYAELDHLVASLGVIRGQIVRMSVAEDSSIQDDLGAQLRDLRERVSTLADGMGEAAAQVGSAPAGNPASPPTG
jgi:hypothetical protein